MGPFASTTRRLCTSAASICMLVAGTTILASPASADTNPNPINWTVYKTFVGPKGGDVPLRYGQHNLGSINGWGKRHIDDSHNPDWGSFDSVIRRTLEDGRCNTVDYTVSCTYGSAFMSRVVYNTRIDSRSGDGRRKGIITAYEWCQVCRVSHTR
jgi:hypothetical protein